ncbi:hypothetical protein Dimus_019228 [Dionaea muscipula]
MQLDELVDMTPVSFSANLAGKRDLKVKALEAAEAAKRLEEKIKNERKQKKEALQLERAKLKQENLRLMELQKNLKEEERKKIDADIAARRRQREEEERKEREGKRKRLDEARRQQREPEGKVQVVTNEYSCKVPGERAHDMMLLKGDTEKHAAREEDDAREPVMELNCAGVSQSNAGMLSIDEHKASTSCDTEKVECNEIRGSSTPLCGKDGYSITKAIREQSYEISPYRCSDDEDEDEEEDDKENKKFIPTWGSKSSVALALTLMQNVDPDVVFPPGSFCSLDEERYNRSSELDSKDDEA